MLARQDVPSKASGADPFMSTVVFFLLVLLAFVLARGAGMTWKAVLHWTGEVLLITGIVLAAVGISDVRHEWTQLPGIRGRTAQAMRTIQARAASLMWKRWNRFVDRSRLARRLGFRLHVKVITGTGSLTLPKLRVTATANSSWNVAPATSDLEGRMTWLETRLQEVGVQIATLHSSHEQEVRDRQAATEQEQKTRLAEVQRIQDSIANLAGGGLRLQTWGVVCLLAGTVMTAIW